MDRFSFARSAHAPLTVFTVLMAATLGGCSLLSTLGYLAHQDTLAPDYAELKGKRIAVVCRPVTELQYADSNAAPDLAVFVGDLLTKNGDKIKVVKSDEVAQWTDEHNWRDYAELGKALKVDMVVGIDLEQFGLYKGQTLYQGHADIHVAVYDIKAGGKRVWEKRVVGTNYPRNTAIPASDRSESEFRHQYLAVLAEHISRFFCEHDPDVDIAVDTNVLDN
jgi:hypothetical protein